MQKAVREKLNIFKLFLLGITACFIGGYLELLIEAKDGFYEVFYSRFSVNVIGRVAVITILAFILITLVYMYAHIVFSALFKYRYVIGLAIIIIVVALNLNGSSIGVWAKWLGMDPSQADTLLGFPKIIRTDEYGVFTPFAFSQKFNHTGAFNYFSDTIRGDITDVSVVYGQPVFNVIVLFRPFLLGYMLLGVERGLSFFWIARLVCLFLVSLEFGRLITKDNRWLSYAYAVMLSFAPTVQWWFAINSLVEMIIMGQLAILLVYLFLHTDKIWKKLLCSLGLGYAGVAYILVLYPAWQVTFAYGYLALLIWVIYKGRKNFKAKIDIPLIGIAVLFMAGFMAYYFHMSGEAISATMNTAYPGSRVVTGGGEFMNTLSGEAGFFYSLSMLVSSGNVNELSQIIAFFPLGLIMSVFIIFKDKKRDTLLILTIFVQLLLYAYICIGFPAVLAKLTLLSNATSGRAMVAASYVNLIQFIRALTLYDRENSRGRSILLSVLFASVITAATVWQSGYYMRELYAYILLAINLLAFYLVFRSGTDKKNVSMFVMVIFFITGFLVNPVQKGSGVIYKNNVVNKIKEITEGDHAKWIVEAGMPYSNLPLFAGAPTINSTNVYPDMDRWHILDPDGVAEDIYNRYAHIDIQLTELPTAFYYGPAPDAFTLYLSYTDMQKLEVGYILSEKDYTGVDTLGVTFTELLHDGKFYIYQINY